MYLILFVLHNPERLDDVITAWNDTGVGGITILPSTGLARLQSKGVWRDDFPLLPSLDDFHDYLERLNRTLFTIVENDDMVDRVIQATEKVIGDLRKPNTGILSVLPISRVYGLNRYIDDVA